MTKTYERLEAKFDCVVATMKVLKEKAGMKSVRVLPGLLPHSIRRVDIQSARVARCLSMHMDDLLKRLRKVDALCKKRHRNQQRLLRRL